MKIEKDKYVEIDYTLYLEDGSIADSSKGKAPLGYVQGNGMLIFGLEAQLEGKSVGDKFKAVIEPKDAYGERNEAYVQKIPREHFETAEKIEVGMAFQASDQNGVPFIVRVVEVDDKTVTIDANHEMAGKTLTFDVEVITVRESTPDDFNTGCGGCGGNCGGCEGGCGNSEGCDCNNK